MSIFAFDQLIPLVPTDRLDTVTCKLEFLLEKVPLSILPGLAYCMLNYTVSQCTDPILGKSNSTVQSDAGNESINLYSAVFKLLVETFSSELEL